MSEAIETMMQEHQRILAALDAFEAFADRVEQGSGYERSDLASFVEFIQKYADAKHHRKEEDILFVAMNQFGFPLNAGPVGVMLSEHKMGRDYVAQLGPIVAASTWGAGEIKAISQAARGFIDLLRAHIMKEDNVLYPMATSRIAPEALAEVDRKCAAVEADYVASGEGARLEKLGETLIKRYSR